jgi:FkbM family methyltransferase
MDARLWQDGCHPERLRVTLKHQVRLLLNHAGIDVQRFPGDRPEHRRVLLLRHHDVRQVLDVGANSGGYGRELRQFGYAGQIMSFEPLSGPWAELRAGADKDPKWTVVRCAVGGVNAEVDINVAANAGASSSILDMLARHTDAAPDAGYVGIETVAQRPLDDLVGTSPQVPTFLKIDVQGYEQEVLAGANGLLDALVGIQLEVSFVPLYAGAPLYRELFDIIESRGFRLESLDAGFSDPRTGQLLQADATFYRG